MRISARLIHIGVRPTTQPTVRPSRTFRRSVGTTLVRVRSWRPIGALGLVIRPTPAIRLVMAPAAFAEAASRNKTGLTYSRARAAVDLAVAQPALPRQICWSAAVAGIRQACVANGGARDPERRRPGH